MANVKRLLVAAAITVALTGVGVPAGADPSPRPAEGTVAGEGWGPLVPVPITTRYRVHVWATAISDLGHIAVAYTATPATLLQAITPGT